MSSSYFVNREPVFWAKESKLVLATVAGFLVS